MIMLSINGPKLAYEHCANGLRGLNRCACKMIRIKGPLGLGAAKGCAV